MQARRREKRRTQDDIAEAVGVTRRQVQRWEAGEGEPYLRQHEAIAKAYDWPLDRIGELLARDGEPATSRGPGAEWVRYQGGPEPAPRVADDQYVTSIREGTQGLVALDSQYGGDDLVSVVVRAFRAAHNRLASGLYVATVERDLQAAVGEAGELAAWVAYDADQQALARQLNQEALLVSRLAGDREMELFELATLAMQSIHLRRSAEALRIAEHLLSDRLSGRTAALFHVRRARALAQLGERQRSLDALRRARSLLAEGITNQDPEWTWWVDDAELAWHEATCFADLDDWPRAAELFREAYDLRPADKAPRGRYNDLAHLLEAQATVGAWHEADETLSEAAAYVGEVGSARTTAVLLRAVDRIKRSPGPSSLIDHADDLRHLLSTSPADGHT